ncbi:single-stranded DNA-binding protein [Helicobacter cappadocius]|uniref:Single-stranded DNA-binding protein n=1 Tax=Helicobacter cappadocius TaxID=3063998 RepID=A0AA90SSI1_9HELI|nr:MULTISPECIES: single-stranded DNA-binding protein [unclassified Helicobacter]MDO7252851.1 single-stranded DNA-binding protein [Helicobacter sp. faydin-H75]MDP2538894.1 single-stranded DNA-binding protein [Helicobacter sp. faydin-H76]
MYNKVIIIGNLTRDVELRYLPSGSALATIGLASNRRYKKQDGSQGEEVCFVDAKLFGRAAEVANQYLRKGSKILIEGRLTLESWTDQTGSKKSKHTITAESMQMLDGKSSSTQDDGYQNYEPSHNESNSSYAQNNHLPKQAPQGGMNAQKYEQNIPEINIDDDEIPF